MRASSDRWVEVTPSRHAHERAGLDYVRERLPDADPYRAWSNLEVVTPRGESLEVDLLVLGPAGLYLVELKDWIGRIRGNSYQWLREDRHRTVVDSPFMSANHKARVLKSQLLESYRRTVPPGRGIPRAEDFVPWVQAAVFLSNPDVVCQFEPSDRMYVYGVEEATETTRLPGLLSRLIFTEPRDPKDRIDPKRSELLGKLLRHAGMGRRRQRRIGPYTLDADPYDSGPGWQDWLATHSKFRDERHRVRIYYVGGSTTAEDRALLERAAEREYRLLRHVDNPGLVAPQEYHDSELGPALVYPYDPGAQRLDQLVAGAGDQLDIGTQLAIIRSLAETLRYAHGRRITHRALSPRCVHVELGAEGPLVKIADWQTGARIAASRSGDASLLAGTRHVTELVDVPTQAYRAPDRPSQGTADEVRLDVFGLGAVSYFLLCGRPPASDAVVLTQRLQAEGGLDVSGDLDSPVEELRSLVLDATRGRVDERLPTMEAFLERLAGVERALAPPEEMASAAEIDPLEAGPEAMVGDRWRVVRRLGAGSSAVALLVEDLADREAPCVLKVARDEDRAPRLREEAEALRQLDDERVARLRSDGVLVVGGRTAVALDYAGDQTLAAYLREKGRLSLDRLDRWGEDLLGVATYLDSAGVNHRDIKPDNLGIRERPRDREAHLVLFDFSLAGTSTAVLEAGTPPYLDPFLGDGSRHRWDAAAERYAVAVTLFEMATGHTPVYGDGVSNPRLVEAEATVDPGRFDPAVAPHLVPFFQRALRRRADERFDTLQEMQRAWKAAFEAAAAEAAKGADADDLAARATRSTPLGESGLSPRAISALEPLGLVTVGNLVDVPPVRLNRLSGVNEGTRREIRGRARQWRERLAAEPAATWEPWQPGDQRLFRPRSIDGVIEQLIPASRGRNTTEVSAARLLLGQDGSVRSANGWLTQGELADLLGVTRVRAQQLDASLRARWSRSGDDNPLLPVRDDLVEILTSLGCAATASEAAQALLALRGSTAQEPARTAQAVGLVRAAVEAELESGGEARLGRARRGDVVWIAIESALGEHRPTADQLIDYATALGRAAAALPVEEDAPVATGVATHRLRAVPAPPSMLPVTDGRLLRIAAAAGGRLAVSPRDELYPRGMAAVAALRHSGAGFPAPNAQPSVENLQERVRARFPEAEPLPGRPELDDLLDAIESPLRWDPAETRYRSRTVMSTSLPTAGPGRTVEAHEDEAGPRAELERRVRDAIARRAFLAISVSSNRVDEERRALTAQYGLIEVNVARVLITRMRELISGTELSWKAVLSADAAAPRSREGEGLRNLVGASVGAVEDAIRAAGGSVLLTQPGLLARYGHLDLIARLADHTTTHPYGVVLLLPAETGAAPTLDRQPLPVLGPMQWVRAPSRGAVRPAVEEAAR